MNLNEYQDRAIEFAIFPDQHMLTYTALGLANEAGEYAGKVKKFLRGDSPLNESALADELGDVIWYVSACATAIGLSLESIALRNLDKLTDRQNRGVIKGSGDNR